MHRVGRKQIRNNVALLLPCNQKPAFERMDLLLWRHGDAMNSRLSPNRPLTERGRQQARRVATWLRAHLPEELRVLASPTARAQQTAAALGLPFESSVLVGPDAGIAANAGPARCSAIIGPGSGLGLQARLPVVV